MKTIVSLLMLTMSLSVFAGKFPKKLESHPGFKTWKSVKCLQCHNPDGMGKAEGSKIRAMKGPQIAGLNAKYAAEQMTAIKAGTRAKGKWAMMKAKFKKITDAEIKDVSDLLSKLGPAHKGMFEK